MWYLSGKLALWISLYVGVSLTLIPERSVSIMMLISVLAQMVACLPLVQQVWGSIPNGIVNFNLKIFNLGARRGGDVHFLIAGLYITGLD